MSEPVFRPTVRHLFIAPFLLPQALRRTLAYSIASNFLMCVCVWGGGGGGEGALW